MQLTKGSAIKALGARNPAPCPVEERDAVLDGAARARQAWAPEAKVLRGEVLRVIDAEQADARRREGVCDGLNLRRDGVRLLLARIWLRFG
jgi:hypothetical protein